MTYICCVFLYTTLLDLGIINNFKALFLRNVKWKMGSASFASIVECLYSVTYKIIFRYHHDVIRFVKIMREKIMKDMLTFSKQGTTSIFTSNY